MNIKSDRFLTNPSENPARIGAISYRLAILAYRSTYKYRRDRMTKHSALFDEEKKLEKITLTLEKGNLREEEREKLRKKQEEMRKELREKQEELRVEDQKLQEQEEKRIKVYLESHRIQIAVMAMTSVYSIERERPHIITNAFYRIIDSSIQKIINNMISSNKKEFLTDYYVLRKFMYGSMIFGNIPLKLGEKKSILYKTLLSDNTVGSMFKLDPFVDYRMDIIRSIAYLFSRIKRVSKNFLLISAHQTWYANYDHLKSLRNFIKNYATFDILQLFVVQTFLILVLGGTDLPFPTKRLIELLDPFKPVAKEMYSVEKLSVIELNTLSYLILQHFCDTDQTIEEEHLKKLDDTCPEGQNLISQFKKVVDIVVDPVMGQIQLASKYLIQQGELQLPGLGNPFVLLAWGTILDNIYNKIRNKVARIKHRSVTYRDYYRLFTISMTKHIDSQFPTSYPRTEYTAIPIELRTETERGNIVFDHEDFLHSPDLVLMTNENKDNKAFQFKDLRKEDEKDSSLNAFVLATQIFSWEKHMANLDNRFEIILDKLNNPNIRYLSYNKNPNFVPHMRTFTNEVQDNPRRTWIFFTNRGFSILRPWTKVVSLGILLAWHNEYNGDYHFTYISVSPRKSFYPSAEIVESFVKPGAEEMTALTPNFNSININNIIQIPLQDSERIITFDEIKTRFNHIDFSGDFTETKFLQAYEFVISLWICDCFIKNISFQGIRNLYRNVFSNSDLDRYLFDRYATKVGIITTNQDEVQH